jgi:hypothetical protein
MITAGTLLASGVGLGQLVAASAGVTERASSAEVVAEAAWWAFGSLLLGAAASVIGGALGVSRIGRERLLPVRRA